MTDYGQFCPVAQAAEVLTERWTPLVIRELALTGSRFNDIQRGVPLMSSSLLSSADASSSARESSNGNSAWMARAPNTI
jgi:hypothetical protein